LFAVFASIFVSTKEQSTRPPSLTTGQINTAVQSSSPCRHSFLLLKNSPVTMTVILSPACYFMISIDCQLHLNISQHDFMYIIVPLCGVSYLLIKRICMYVSVFFSSTKTKTKTSSTKIN